MIVTTLQTTVLICATLGGLALIGYPVKRSLDRLRSPLCVPTMVIGLAVFEVVAWYWFELGHRGLAWPVTVLLGLAALFALVDVSRRRGKILHVDQRAVRRAATSLSIGFIIVAINWSTVLSLPLLTTATTDNNDSVSYAVAAENLVRGGFNDPGPVVGYHLGALARTDAFGSVALIAGVSDISGLGSWRVSTSTLLALTILATYGLAVFIDTLLGGDRWLLASVTAGAASCTLLFVYVQVLFYVGQIMAMAVVPLLAVAAIHVRDARRPRQLLGPLVSATAVCLIMLSHYAHMLVFGAPLFVLPVVFDRRIGETWRIAVRRAFRTAVVMVAAVVAALILVPIWYQDTINYIRSKGDAVAGFVLPGFTPAELLGFMRMVLPKPSAARVIWSVVCVVVVIALALLVRGTYQRLVRYSTIFAALVFLSYGAIYRREGGPSYRQWKWITFFQPTLVVLAVAIGAVAFERVVASRAARTRGVAVATALGFAVVASANTGSGRGTALRDRRHFSYATPEQYGLSTDPVLKGITAVNVDLNPYWDTMWAVYFLPGKMLYLQQPSYYTVTSPQAEWTLLPRTGSMQGPAVHDINALFRLVHDDPSAPLSDDAAALDGAVSVTIDQNSVASGQLTGTVSATNNGRARWLPLTASVGGVTVGVHLEDDAGRMLDYEWQRIQLIQDRTFDLPPDTTTAAPFVFPTLPPGHYRLVFELVSEQVNWFGVPVTEDVVVP